MEESRTHLVLFQVAILNPGFSHKETEREVEGHITLEKAQMSFLNGKRLFFL